MDTIHIFTVEPVGSLEFLPIGILCVFQTVVFPVILHSLERAFVNPTVFLLVHLHSP